MPRVSRTAPSKPEAQSSAPQRRPRTYVAKRDYGSRGAERAKQIVKFGRARATIYKRADIDNSSWFFRLYLKEEKRHFRRSLKTSDRREALDILHDEVVAILAKQQTGQRILAVPLKDLVSRYRSHLQSRLDSGAIARKTMLLNQYRIAHGCEFLASVYEAGMATKISAIDGASFEGYLKWRADRRAAKNKGATIRRDVVRDELIAIRKMFLYAKKEKLCTEKSIPQWSFVVEKESPRRRRMEHKDYKAVVVCIRHWVHEAKDKREGYNRRLLQSVFMVIAQTGMRTGEAFGLRNSDVVARPLKNEAIVSIRPETSKVRKGRRIVVFTRQGHTMTEEINPLLMWLKVQRNKEPGDFVFSAFDNGKRSARDVYYHAYKQLRKRLHTLNLAWFDTYHCRHYWITTRLYAKESPYEIAALAGTSIKEIQSTYSHVLEELIGREMNKRDVKYAEDGTPVVVEKQ
jgi:integrase